MLPLILGAVALSAIGYGVGRILTDDNFRDDVKDKIQDIALKGYESIENLEEKMGLNEYRFTDDDEVKGD